MKFPYVILGGGVAAGYAAREFVANGVESGALCIASAEPVPPYDRPPLSKDVLTGKTQRVQDILIEARDFYAEHGIVLKLDLPIVEVDLEKRTLSADSQKIGFEKLLIAPGSRPRRLDVPGAHLDGIHYLRSASDAAAILAATEEAASSLVIGGGFIGTEVASSLAQNDLEVTLCHRGEHLMKGSPLSPEIGEFFSRYFGELGVELRRATTVGAFNGRSKLEGVELDPPDTMSPDMVVVGIGAMPNTELFIDSPLEAQDGIRVDEHLETAVADVYAAGDVARYPDLLLGGERRVEHWDSARRQGAHAARSMLGDKRPFAYIPYFFSDVFDLSWEYWGDSALADSVVYRGAIESGSFSAWWLKNDRVVGAFVMNRPDEERELAPHLIKEARPIEPERLTDTTLPLPRAEESSLT